MQDSIIGLDLGYGGLKAVRLRRGFRGLEWVKAVEKEWTAGANPLDWIPGSNGSPRGPGGEARPPEIPEPAVAVIREALAELSAGKAIVAVSIPTHYCSLRILTLPFSDERRIAQVIPFEVEPLLPLPLDEMVVDYQPLVSEENQTRLLAAAVPKKTIEHLLSLLAMAGVDPATIELDALALYTLAGYGIKESEGESLAVVDVGAAKTAVLVVDQGNPRYVRSFLQGSRQWTSAIEKSLSLPGPSAEERKRTIGLDNGISEALLGPLNDWVDELNRTLHVARRECRHSLGGIVLCGGGARLRGIDRFIRESLDLEIRKLDLPLLKEKSVSWDGTWSQALGLALRGGGVRKGSRINFRKGEFSYQEEIAQSKRKALWIWAGLGLLLALGVADLSLKYRLQVSRYEAAKSELRQAFTQMFPEVKNVVDELHQAQSSVDDLKKKLALFGRRDRSALRVMGELTDRIPKEIRIEVRALSIEPERVRMEAETASFETVDRIKAAVAESEMFSEPEVSNAKILSDKEGKVRFDLTLRLGRAEKGS